MQFRGAGTDAGRTFWSISNAVSCSPIQTRFCPPPRNLTFGTQSKGSRGFIWAIWAILQQPFQMQFRGEQRGHTSRADVLIWSISNAASREDKRRVRSDPFDSHPNQNKKFNIYKQYKQTNKHPNPKQNKHKPNLKTHKINRQEQKQK